MLKEKYSGLPVLVVLVVLLVVTIDTRWKEMQFFRSHKKNRFLAIVTRELTDETMYNSNSTLFWVAYSYTYFSWQCTQFRILSLMTSPQKVLHHGEHGRVRAKRSFICRSFRSEDGLLLPPEHAIWQKSVRFFVRYSRSTSPTAPNPTTQPTFGVILIPENNIVNFATWFIWMQN